MQSNLWVQVNETIWEFDNQNPHRVDTQAFAKYEQIKHAQNVGEAKAKGASTWDLNEYFKKQKLRVLEVANPKGKGWKEGVGGKGGGGKKGGGVNPGGGKPGTSLTENSKNEVPVVEEHLFNEVHLGKKIGVHAVVDSAMSEALVEVAVAGSSVKEPSAKQARTETDKHAKLATMKNKISPVRTRTLDFSVATPVAQKPPGIESNTNVAGFAQGENLVTGIGWQASSNIRYGPYPAASSTQEGSHQIRLAAFAQLLDEKLAPIQSYITTLDAKIEQYRQNSQDDMWEMRCRLGDDIEGVAQDLHHKIQQLQFR